MAVDDAGRIINPLLAEGQRHGGIAQGVGQALYEEMAYDDNGNPLTVTLADYTMPGAADLPSFELLTRQTPTPHNPLGAKGIGEAGTIGSVPAVQNAVIDARIAPRRTPHRHAPDAGAGVAGHPGGHQRSRWPRRPRFRRGGPRAGRSSTPACP